MSNPVNDIIIEEALEVAAELDEIESNGHVHTVEMYVQDSDLESVYQWLRQHKATLRAYNDVAHQSSLEIY